MEKTDVLRDEKTKKTDVISLEQVLVNKLVYKKDHPLMPGRIITEYWTLKGVLIAVEDELDNYRSIISTDKRFGFGDF